MKGRGPGSLHSVAEPPAAASRLRIVTLLAMIVLLTLTEVAQPSVLSVGPTLLAGDLRPAPRPWFGTTPVAELGPRGEISGASEAPEIQAPTLRVYSRVLGARDSLDSVAAQFGVSTGTLLLANPEAIAGTLVPGTVLHVPAVDLDAAWRCAGGETVRDVADYYRRSAVDVGLTNGLPADKPLPAGTMVYVPAAGAAASRMIWPVIGRISQEFGGPPERPHRGLDISAPLGTPILCPMDGLVTDVGSDRYLGLYVRVRHRGGLETVYGHMSRQLVAVGQDVETSDVLGLIGSTGRSTGPHLHFVVLRDGRPLDPLDWLPGVGE